MKPKKLEYRGTDKVKLYLQRCVNWLLDNSGKTEVNVEPSLLSGVKVADITVDEETTSIFAPNPPTVKNNISEMNDVELTNLSDGQILKYDDTEEKWINVNETGGTEVEANPQGTPTDTLQTIEIDGVIYSVEGGSPTPTENIKYTIVTASTGTYDAAITINKYINDALDTTETIVYTDILGTWKDYDYFKVGYNVISSPYWSVQVLHDVEEYAAGYTDTWHYTNTKNITFTVDSGDVALSDLSDVELTNLSDGQILKYDDTEEKWVNADETGGTEVEANPSGEPTATLTTIEIDGTVYDIAGGGGSGSGSEIIPITAGDDTTSRTFTFTKQPKFIKFYWMGLGWTTDATLVWGQPYMTYMAHEQYVSITGNQGGIIAIAYGNDGKSITITGGNPFGSFNNSDGSGYMFVSYGGGSGGGASNLSDLSDVDLTNLSDGQILQYNSTSEKWENADNQGSLPFEFVIDPNDNGINLIYSQLINGITKVYDSTDSGISSYTIEESGIYIVINTYSANSTHEITVPQSARIINSGNLGSDRGVSWIIAELQDDDEVTINTIPSNWVAFSKVVYRIDGISIESLVDTSYQSDGTATYTPPQDNSHYLMVGVSMGRTAGLYRNDTDTSSSSCDIMIEQDVGVNTTIGIYYGIGNQLPQANFYGYDGGCSCIFNYLIGGD